MNPRIIDITSKANTVAAILRDSGRSVAATARVCKTSTGTVEAWLEGQAPRYKFAPLIARATGVDEAVVHAAVKKANQDKQEYRNSVKPTPQMAAASSDCGEAVVDRCLLALDLATIIICLDDPEREMLRTFAVTLAAGKDGAG